LDWSLVTIVIRTAFAFTLTTIALAVTLTFALLTAVLFASGALAFAIVATLGLTARVHFGSSSEVGILKKKI